LLQTDKFPPVENDSECDVLGTSERGGANREYIQIKRMPIKSKTAGEKVPIIKERRNTQLEMAV
jgi:hypothetical protein